MSREIYIVQLPSKERVFTVVVDESKRHVHLCSPSKKGTRGSDKEEKRKERERGKERRGLCVQR